MKINFTSLKKIYFIASGYINLFAFLISIFSTNSKSETFKEFTTLSRFFINLYTLLMLTILAIHLTNPQIICGFIIKNMNLLSTNKGKIIVYYIISVMYWSIRAKPQLFFAATSFITTSVMLLIEILTNLKKKNLVQKDMKIEIKNSEIVNSVSPVKNNGITNSDDNTENENKKSSENSIPGKIDNESNNTNNGNNTNNTTNNNETNNTTNIAPIGLINE